MDLIAFWPTKYAKRITKYRWFSGVRGARRGLVNMEVGGSCVELDDLAGFNEHSDKYAMVWCLCANINGFLIN